MSGLNDPQNIARMALETIRTDGDINQWMADNYPGKTLARYLGSYPGDVVGEADAPFVIIPTQGGMLRHGRGTEHTLHIAVVVYDEAKEELDNWIKSDRGFRLVSQLTYLVWKAVSQASSNGWKCDSGSTYEIAPASFYPQFAGDIQINLTMMI